MNPRTITLRLAALLGVLVAADASAQATTNQATRMSGPTLPAGARMGTVCFGQAAGTQRVLGPYTLADTDIGDSPMVLTVRLVRGTGGSNNSTVSISNQDVEVQPLPPGEVGFVAFGRLANMNSALSTLRYTAGLATDPTDRIDVEFNDVDDPRLIANLRFYATPGTAGTTFSSCAPTLDLVAESDTGTSNTDDITADATPTFLISPVPVGAEVQLRLKEAVVATGTATETSILLTQPDPLPEQTDSWSYDVVVNGGPPSSNFTIAYIFIEQPLFSDGFE